MTQQNSPSGPHQPRHLLYNALQEELPELGVNFQLTFSPPPPPSAGTNMQRFVRLTLLHCCMNIKHTFAPHSLNTSHITPQVMLSLLTLRCGFGANKSAVLSKNRSQLSALTSFFPPSFPVKEVLNSAELFTAAVLRGFSYHPPLCN